MLSPKAIKEFKGIYKVIVGQDISDQEALVLATDLINLFKVIYRPLTGGKVEKNTSPKH